MTQQDLINQLMYGSAPMTQAGRNMRLENLLTNAVMEREYAAQHPIKTGIGRVTGKGNGYRPLGTVTDTVGNAATDVAMEGAEAAIKNKGLKGLFNKQNFGWSKGSGVKAFGKNIGKGANVIGGVVQGAQALNNLSQLDKVNDAGEELQSQVLNSYSSNPMAGLYLTAEQKSLLRDLQHGGIDTNPEFEDFMPDSLGDIVSPLLQGGLGFLTGGIPGAVIGGVGGLVNTGLSGATEDAQRRNAELEALLSTLEQAEMEQQQMLRSGAHRRFAEYYM